MDSGSPEVILEGQDPETIFDEDSSSDFDEYYDAISFDDKCWMESVSEAAGTESQIDGRSESPHIPTRMIAMECECCTQMPVGNMQKKVKCQYSEDKTQKWRKPSKRLKSGFQKGDLVWLYIPKDQPGLSRRLAHMWHGPFRIEEKHADFRVKLQMNDTGYRVSPWVHISRLKLCTLGPQRPTMEIEVADDDKFDVALLPEDSWEPDSKRNDNEVEKSWISDGRK
ncbi:unnamed protein product [Phytophthora fragariaefolia]|uniref:Unnamed protein product n=1 Tax=Phytophthora fragariaefolia TaxID=1490495 RepID=A0A9W6YGU9_9STRA|nr:unnamed protein product [Phytophthora fragariaefolia]